MSINYFLRIYLSKPPIKSEIINSFKEAIDKVRKKLKKLGYSVNLRIMVPHI